MPSLFISTSIIASLAIVLFLLIYSHRPFKIQAGRRYIAACISSTILWMVLLFFFDGFKINDQSTISDLIAGVLIFLASIPAIFPFYSVISWGFRIAMLIRLDEQSQPITLDAWMRAYCNGADMDVFYQDRMQTLYRFGMVISENDQIKLTPLIGKTFGVLAKVLHALMMPVKEGL